MCCEEAGQETEFQLCARKETGQLEEVILYIFLFCSTFFAAFLTRSPLDVVNMKLPLCCSSSVGSEESSLEKVKLKTEVNQEEELATSEEELGAGAPSPPPAVRELPLHLQKQHVRKTSRRVLCK